jgi:FtsZ-interacting cell division protein ZipA
VVDDRARFPKIVPGHPRDLTEEDPVDTWLIVVIVVAVLIVLALIALAVAKRGTAAKARKQEQARDHLQEAQLRAARADKEQALADEQAARARRERAEVEERAAQAEREARERAGHAQQERSAAQELRAKAEKLAPGMSHGDGHVGDAQAADVTQQIRREDIRPRDTGGGATRA